MPEAIENYTSQTTLKDIKRLAVLAWFIGFAFVFIWVASIVLAPIFEGNGLANISAPIYNFFSFLCHQQSSRSFHIENHAFAVCSRCFGIYFGLLTGFIIYLFIRKIEEIEPFSRIWLFLALIPMGIDWGLTAFDIWENTHLSRFITGLILGVTCAIFIVPALVEIVRLLSNKSKRFQSKK